MRSALELVIAGADIYTLSTSTYQSDPLLGP
jgi:hypothetical protein